MHQYAPARAAEVGLGKVRSVSNKIKLKIEDRHAIDAAMQQEYANLCSSERTSRRYSPRPADH